MVYSGWKQWYISHLALAITFLTSGLTINAIQFVLYILIRPWNKPLFRTLNYYLTCSLHWHIIFFAQWWGDVQVTTYINEKDLKYYGKEHGFVVMSHKYEIDWVAGWVLCNDIGILGNCKTFGKKSIQYIPTMGLSWKLGGSVFLERNWQKDQEIIGRQLRELVCDERPLWLMLAAEGTRFTEEKHVASLQFAKEKGLPLLQHHLTPRTRGFVSSLPFIRGKIPAIYSATIGIRENTVAPSMANCIAGKPIEVSIFMERIPTEKIPVGEEEGTTWLHEHYSKKDKLLGSYLKTGDWFAESGYARVPSIKHPRAIKPLINMICWAVLVLVPLTYYFVSLISTGNPYAVAVSLLVIFFIFYSKNRILQETQISRGSSYGASPPTSPVH